MSELLVEFELDPVDGHPSPFETARVLSESISGDFRVFEDLDSGNILVVSEAEE